VQPTRIPKPGEIDAYNAYIHASADSAARAAQLATDPDEIAARRRERRLTRLLLVMVFLIIIGGFVISLVGVLITGGNGAPSGQ
jgi:hypothetical protein